MVARVWVSRSIATPSLASDLNIKKFRCLGFRRAGHTRQLLVEAKIVLNRDGRQGLGLTFDRDPFLGFRSKYQKIPMPRFPPCRSYPPAFGRGENSFES